jgi:L-asparagine transporter-like permease
VRLILFYLLTLALVLAIVPWPSAGIDESPFVKVMRAVHVPGAAGVFNFVILAAALSAMNSQLYITTRMMFSLSRAGDAPRRFGVLNARGVPLQALLLSSIGIALAVVLSVLAPKSAFILMVAISSFGAMFTWMMIFVTHYAFRTVRAASGAPPPRFRMRGFPATTLLGAALMAAVLLTTAFTSAFRMTLVFGLPFIAILSLIYLLRYRRSAPECHGSATHTGVKCVTPHAEDFSHGRQADSGRIPQRHAVPDGEGRRGRHRFLQARLRCDGVVSDGRPEGRDRTRGNQDR